MSDKQNKSFASLFEELNGVPLEADNIPEDEGAILTDEMDHAILMHRDAHFGGEFSIMIDYYKNEENIGVDPELDYERICYLAEVEKQLQQNLASVMLSTAEAEQVARCRQAYSQLKSLYEGPTAASAQLIADLILSEEADPIAEIEAICTTGTELVPLLIDLVRSDEAYSPLFPGYGYAPYLAAICLGKIQDTRSLIPLFEMFHKQSIFDDEALLEVFSDFGEQAKLFLMQRVRSRPLTLDNTHAAFALSVFSTDTDVAVLAIEQLKDTVVQRHSLLSTYLLCLCDSLKDSVHKHDLISLCEVPNLPKEIALQIKNLVRDWH